MIDCPKSIDEPVERKRETEGAARAELARKGGKAAEASEHRRVLFDFSSLGQLNCELPDCILGRLYTLSASVSAPIRPPHAASESVTTTTKTRCSPSPRKSSTRRGATTAIADSRAWRDRAAWMDIVEGTA